MNDLLILIQHATYGCFLTIPYTPETLSSIANSKSYSIDFGIASYEFNSETIENIRELPGIVKILIIKASDLEAAKLRLESENA